ncbi:metalloregulator ArsR/SmtB family transcription factor [Jeotgalibacillus sp. ET6]|uniref:ArsR/SmtB family transcription factor n=1 Tax=Jeotgalibacillus sp. ET6 TaxID=3037260 RepID=UPI002418B1D3|nr:metalloregulator ArsR/SmtB family transcription factor [Jeotgalibacillus sp. ET6]MDG5472772.1 metalloregulator ArsR/SmtB family transcription factor [Jeotgalibacillus sp. ET6]
MKEHTLKADPDTFRLYEKKFKALADEKRLNILHLVQQHDSVCVCDLGEMIDMPQSKLSYHLKQLLDAEFVTVEKKGTWNYYSINDEELNGVLSAQLCCLFRNEDKC